MDLNNLEKIITQRKFPPSAATHVHATSALADAVPELIALVRKQEVELAAARSKLEMPLAERVTALFDPTPTTIAGAGEPDAHDYSRDEMLEQEPEASASEQLKELATYCNKFRKTAKGIGLGWVVGRLRAITAQVQALESCAPAPVATHDSDPWLTLAHIICADAGIEVGHIGDRLNTLRDMLEQQRATTLLNARNNQMMRTDISVRLREYASNPSYSHNDYADTMQAAAWEIERYYGGMLAWKQTAETKDRKLSEEIEARVSERCAARQVVDPQHDQVKLAVDRFLGWKLPPTFSPDNGIDFNRPDHLQFWPIGTNLFTADQAKAMFEYCLAAHSQQQGAEPSACKLGGGCRCATEEGGISESCKYHAAPAIQQEGAALDVLAARVVEWLIGQGHMDWHSDGADESGHEDGFNSSSEEAATLRHYVGKAVAALDEAPAPAQPAPVANAALERTAKESDARYSQGCNDGWAEGQQHLKDQPDAAPVDAKEKIAELTRSGLSLMVELKKVKDEHAKVLQDAYGAMLWLHRRLPPAYKPFATIDQIIETVGRAMGYDAREDIAEKSAQDYVQPASQVVDAAFAQGRASGIEEAAKLIEQGQETHVANGPDGASNERIVTPRKAHNLMGLAYANAIRALNKQALTDTAASSMHSRPGGWSIDVPANTSILDTFKTKVDSLISTAEAFGVVVRIETRPLLPLAMGNYEMVASVQERRAPGVPYDRLGKSVATEPVCDSCNGTGVFGILGHLCPFCSTPLAPQIVAAQEGGAA